MNRRDFIAKSATLYAAQALAVAAIAYVILDLGAHRLKVPFNYDGDSMVILMYIKGMLLNGWTFAIPQLSAPFGLDAAAFPIMTNADWLIMKVISLFTSELGLVLNLFWLLTLALSAASCTVALRLLGLGRLYAFGAGLSYAFLPFALMRNVAHMNLVYYLVPLLGLLAVHLATGLANEHDKLIRRVAYGACVAQGFDYVYYSFFAVLVFVFAAVVGYAGTRSRRVPRVAAVAIALVIGATSLNLSPSLYSWYQSGKPSEMDYKVPAEAEVYGAKIRRMIVPNPDNPVPFLAGWAAQDRANDYANENENVTARLGMGASAGFILLLLISMRVVRVPKDETGVMLGRLAPLTLFTLLFITVGGVGAVFNLFFSSDIRAYNRFSVFLAFFSLAGLGFALRAWMPRGRLGSWLMVPVMAMLFMLGLYDQLLDCNLPARGPGDAEQYVADRELAGKMQAMYPAGASILQLPLTGFPPAYHLNRMVSYDHLRPFLWSGPNMHWSWPSFSLRHRSWQDRLAAEPPAATVDAAIFSRFDAILIDRYGYKDGAKQLVSAFEAAGAMRACERSRYVVFDLAKAKRQLVAGLGEDGFARKRQDWLEPVRIVWGPGFYGPEMTPAGVRFRWSSNRSSLFVYNDSPLPKTLRIDFDVGPRGPGTILVDSGTRQWRIESKDQPSHASLELGVAGSAKATLTFESNVARVVAPGDTRDLYFNVENFVYTERADDAGAKVVADTGAQRR